MLSTDKSMLGTSDMNGAARTLDHATNSVHKAIDKASDAARPVVERISESAHQAVDKLAGAAARAAETLDEKGVQLRDAQTRATAGMRSFILEKPLTSLGIAVAGGFLLSWLLKRS